MKAFLKNFRQSPRKVRLIADLVRGKDVKSARTELKYLAKRGSRPLLKLMESAVANAKKEGIEDTQNLFIKSIRVDKGVTLSRSRPRAFGRAFPINKRSSHIVVELGAKKD